MFKIIFFILMIFFGLSTIVTPVVSQIFIRWTEKKFEIIFSEDVNYITAISLFLFNLINFIIFLAFMCK